MKEKTTNELAAGLWNEWQEFNTDAKGVCGVDAIGSDQVQIWLDNRPELEGKGSLVDFLTALVAQGVKVYSDEVDEEYLVKEFDTYQNLMLDHKVKAIVEGMAVWLTDGKRVLEGKVVNWFVNYKGNMTVAVSLTQEQINQA